MKILCIMHADFETPGVIENWANKKGYPFKIVKPYKDENCSAVEDFTWLIVMGGPQTPLALKKFPYLKDEIDFIGRTVAQKKLVLGFCLGAQLIGEAFGAKTERSPEKEIGVFPIQLTSAAAQDPIMKDLPKSIPVTHWHNDMPGLTQNSVLLGSSQGCPRQIVRYGPLAYGFQCHLEISHDGMKTMIAACGDDLKPLRYVQNEAELLKQDYTSINKIMFTILDRFSELRN